LPDRAFAPPACALHPHGSHNSQSATPHSQRVDPGIRGSATQSAVS
jgi:hypothetical protein